MEVKFTLTQNKEVFVIIVSYFNIFFHHQNVIFIYISNRALTKNRGFVRF